MRLLARPLAVTPVTFVRHPRVDDAYRGVCYGRSDVPLGPDGIAESLAIADRLALSPFRHVVCSGAARTLVLARRVCELTGLRLTIEPALLERDFGGWELRTWDDIHAEVGDAMNGLIDAPETYRPGEGETTHELRDRAMGWYGRRPTDGPILVVAHGGPIAAIRGVLAGKPAAQWPGLIPPPGGVVELATPPG